MRICSEFQHDLKSFWQRHDSTLSVLDFESWAATIDLAHNLYRGMPASFNRFFAFWQYRAIQKLLQACPPRFGERVLDLGCGTGRWSRLFQNLGASTVGVDLGMNALRWAFQLSPSGSWAAMEIPHLGFRDASFDWAVSVTVLQHLPYESQEEALRETRRVLRPEGRLIAMELCGESEEEFYVFPRPRMGWEDLFSRYGFQVVKRQVSERIPWVPLFRCLARWKPDGGEKGRRPLVEWASAWLHRGRTPVAGLLLYLFLAIGYPLEGLAAAIGLDRWARYTAWLLRRRD